MLGGTPRAPPPEAAVALGVHALGFVFWPSSPRGTTVEHAADIIRELPPFVTPVGIFVDPTPDELLRARDVGGIRLAQVHGSAPPAPPPGLAILQAVHLTGHDGHVVPEVKEGAPVLVDAFDPHARGGTGRTIDWSKAAVVARSRHVILAGGLNAGNVADAIRTVRPYGVDVSSGVEHSPGIKDSEKLAAFVAAVKAA
jgi:phosphoribosylanthranilate isomerase